MKNLCRGRNEACPYFCFQPVIFENYLEKLILFIIYSFTGIGILDMLYH